MIVFTREYKGEIINCYFNFSNNIFEAELKPNEQILIGQKTVKPSNYLIVKSIEKK